MSTLRSSNLDRAAYRRKCRQKLSEHIKDKLGISIEPAEVRLITSGDDPYAWQILPEKQHLFKKHLSKHSIGAYRELCRGVGVSFEAVLAPKSKNVAEEISHEQRSSNASSLEVSFTTVIEQLTSEKLKLSAALSESNDQITKATEMKELAEEEVTRLKSIIQEFKMDKQILQQQVQNLTDLVEYFKNTTRQSVDEFMNQFKLNLNLVAAG